MCGCKDGRSTSASDSTLASRAAVDDGGVAVLPRPEDSSIVAFRRKGLLDRGSAMIVGLGYGYSSKRLSACLYILVGSAIAYVVRFGLCACQLHGHCVKDKSIHPGQLEQGSSGQGIRGLYCNY